MPSFRPLAPEASQPQTPIGDLLAIGELIDDAMQPGHFFAAPDLPLEWIAARAETIPWEIFHGRLIDATQTRQTQRFLAWHVAERDAPEPLLSVKLDVKSRQIHVIRGVLAYIWEGHGDGSIIESRETTRWTRELVGTVSIDQFANQESLRDELICMIWQAIVGTSRLPLHSVEAPLPAFVLGQLHYCYRAGGQPSGTWESFARASLQAPLAWSERVKLVEFALRHIAADDVSRLAELLHGEPTLKLLRALFNDVSLSPYTRFVDNAIGLLNCLTAIGSLSIDEKIDFLSYLLRQIARHLTAYDLVTFHHRGANYPDALLLDAALKSYLSLIKEVPQRFLGDDARLRRRALRQACLMRWHYEGHLVPDAPTSPGENARVMPPSHPRIPEEQLTQPTRRRRRLYADEPLADLLGNEARRVLSAAMQDLAHADEQIELGIGVFIDRPLGYSKAAVAPDQTPILAHEAFSPSIARRRLDELCKRCAAVGIECPTRTPTALPQGLPHAELAECPRPVAALSDVRKVASDFVILRTLPAGMRCLMQLGDLRALADRYRLAFLTSEFPRIMMQARSGELSIIAVYDDRLRRRIELSVDDSEGYQIRAGVEWPRAGLRVVTVWEDTDKPDVFALQRPAGNTSSRPS